MFTEEFSFEERADLIRMEFDRRAPKIRLSIFAYMVEAGLLDDNMGTEEFLALMHKVNEFITEDVEDYAKDVAKLQPAVSETGEGLGDLNILTLGDDDPYGQGGKGSL